MPSSKKHNMCSDQSGPGAFMNGRKFEKFLYVLGDVLMPYLNNHCTRICFGYALEAYSAAGGSKIPSDFASYFGASGFL